jgi:hypothetical protein
MPNSLTLLHVPDILYERLSAQFHGRSLNNSYRLLKTADARLVGAIRRQA